MFYFAAILGGARVMLTKRIIPCLDVKDGVVVKGVCFRNHQVVGDIVELAKIYCDMGADELVFYDITASSDNRSVCCDWVKKVAKVINIPFCVAGGIRTVDQARSVLQAGADKISINSPAIENPDFIDTLVAAFGQQCIVIGIDSFKQKDNYIVYQYTGDEAKSRPTPLSTKDWIREVQTRGAGEIVLNCMNRDGVRQGYDIEQLVEMRSVTNVPLIASGGAGACEHFLDVFNIARVDGALAASIFHKRVISLSDLKSFLKTNKIEVRQ